MHYRGFGAQYVLRRPQNSRIGTVSNGDKIGEISSRLKHGTIAGSIKGNVKENIPPSTGREELFLPSSPCPLCEMLGCAVLPLVLGFLQLFHLGSCIFISSDDADQSLKLSKPCGCACQPWIYLRLVA